MKEPEKEVYQDVAREVIRIYKDNVDKPLKKVQVITTEDNADFTYFIKNISEFKITSLLFDLPPWVAIKSSIPSIINPGKTIKVELLIDTKTERKSSSIKIEPRITIVKIA